MTSRSVWPVCLALLLAAAPVAAQRPGNPRGTTPPAPPNTPPISLVLIAPDGREIPLVTPGQSTSGPLDLPAGIYQLRIDPAGISPVPTPNILFLTLANATSLELRREAPTTPPAIPPGPPPGGPPAGAIGPVLLDLNPAPGDQGQREVAAEPEMGIEVQLTGMGLPAIYGFSAEIEFDPAQISMAGGGFTPSSFIPGLVPLVDSSEPGRVEAGGANFTKATASGNGDLGVLAFQTAAGFTGRTEIRLTEVKLRKVDGTEVVNANQRITVVAAAGPPGHARKPTGGPAAPPPSGEEAVAQLLSTKACAGCDLSGARLATQDLTGAELSKAKLTGANLFRVTLASAKLVEASLVDANMLQADLTGADLSGADLTNARMNAAKLIDANLTGAVLDGAKLNGTDLSNATWTDGRKCASGSLGRCR